MMSVTLQKRYPNNETDTVGPESVALISHELKLIGRLQRTHNSSLALSICQYTSVFIEKARASVNKKNYDLNVF